MSTPNPLFPVLVVDDNIDDLFVLRQRLLRTGIPNPIVTFEDGAEAMAHLKRVLGGENEPVPVIMFLDLRMPKCGGFEVLKWVRTQPGLSPMPVVIVSNSPLPENAARAKQLGASRFVAKFPSPDALADMVADASAERTG